MSKICYFFNTQAGCQNKNCTFSHQYPPQPQLQQQNLNTNSNSYQPNNQQQQNPNTNSNPNRPNSKQQHVYYQSNHRNDNGQLAYFRPQNQNQNQNQGPPNHHSNSNFNNNGNNNQGSSNHGNNNQRNQNKKSKPKDYKAQGAELEQKLLCLMGLISSGRIINKISIRIVASCNFAFENGQFIPDINNKNAKCHVFYKENERVKPTTFYIDYTEDNRNRIERLLQAIKAKTNDYILKEDNENPYVLFYCGQISTSFPTFESLYYDGLEKGNLQLFKKDFTKKDERYKVNCFIGSQTFSCKYVMGNYQIISRELHRNQNQERAKDDSFCVVCLDNDATHAIVPCGHLCVCAECGDPTKLYNCPMCRGRIGQFMKIF